MEWKNKSMEHENAYKETKKRLEGNSPQKNLSNKVYNKLLDREQFLIKQHEAKIKAMSKVQVDQTNDNLDIILQLEQENQLLRQQLGQPSQQLTLHHPTSATFQLCNNAEVKYMYTTMSTSFTHLLCIDCKHISA